MLIESFYLPNIEYFLLLFENDNIYIEAFENYQKQSYRNRCKILTTNKIADLIVPVIKGNSKEIIKNIKIDYGQDWQRNHLRTIKSAYGKAPFFEHFYDFFRIVFEKKHDFLIDFNTELLTVCLKLMQIKKEPKFTERFEIKAENDFRGIIHPKKATESITNIEAYNYSQNFGEKFVPNLSIIDLLMCQGPQSVKILSKQNK